MTKSRLTQKELKRNLSYNPDDGSFIRVIANSGAVKIGDRAGSIHNHGYISIKVNSKCYLAHRLVFLYIDGIFPQNHVDHINHIKTDNRLVNLRKVTCQENHKNVTLQKSNTSGVVGVNYDKKGSNWRARIGVNKDRINLGCFLDKFDAICARKSAEKRYNYHENHGSKLVKVWYQK